MDTVDVIAAAVERAAQQAAVERAQRAAAIRATVERGSPAPRQSEQRARSLSRARAIARRTRPLLYPEK